jgi:hypothetical protein
VVSDFFDVLFQCPSVSDIQELHPLTDAEDRFPTLEYPSHRREEKSVVLWHDATGSVFLMTVETRIDIWSSREDIGITHIEIALEMSSKCRDDDRYAS